MSSASTQPRIRIFLQAASLALAGALVILSLTACSSGSSSSASGNGDEGTPDSSAAFSDLSSYPQADMTGYDCAADYDGTYRFVDMTVRQVADEMDKGSTFVVYAGYDDCPWCNSILNQFNDLLAERGITAAYIDTRKDPSWQNNMQIDDYDLLVERFGDAIAEDDDGTKHLYVPQLFFVKDGALVADHPGTVEGHASPSDPLTDEQAAAYNEIINGYLDQLAS